MVLSRLLLRNRYSPLQLLGAAVVIGGVTVAVSPSLSPAANDPHPDDPSATPVAVTAWIGVFVFSCIPQSLLNVLIERSLPLPQDSALQLELAYSSSVASGGGGGRRPWGQPLLRDVVLRTVGTFVRLRSLGRSLLFDAFFGLISANCANSSAGLADEPCLHAV